MQPTPHAPQRVLTLITALFLLIAPGFTARAVTLQWDDDLITSGIQQMNGNREWTPGVPTAGNWSADSGVSHVNWINANNDTANISFGTERQMLLQNAITVNAIELNNTNGTGTRRLEIRNNTLTLTSGLVSGNLVGKAEQMQFFSQISGSSGVTFNNIEIAWLFNNSNNFTGDIVMNGGTLNHDNQAGDPYGAAGNKIRLNNATLNSGNGGNTATIVREVVVIGDVLLRGHSGNGLGLNPLVMNGPITGNGNVLFTNQTSNNVGQLTLGGAASNTYDGLTQAYANLLQLNKSGGATAIAGDLEIGGGPVGTDVVRLLAANQIADTSALTINASGKLELNNFLETIDSLSIFSGGIIDTSSSSVLTMNLLNFNGAPQSAGTYDSTDYAFITGTGSLVVIPEPSSLALFGLAGLAAVLLRRRRR